MSIAAYLGFIVALITLSFLLAALSDLSHSKLEKYCSAHDPARFQAILERLAATQPALRLAWMIVVVSFIAFIVISEASIQFASIWAWIDRIATLAILLVGIQLLRPQLAQGKSFEAAIYWAWPLMSLVRIVVSPIIRAQGLVAERLAAHSNGIDVPGIDELPGENAEADADLPETPAKMIEGLMELPEIDVAEVMTPRTEMVMLKQTETIENARSIISTSGHSRVPVYAENRDEVLGVVHAKDLLAHLSSESDTLESIELRTPVYVPEDKPVDVLLREFQRQRVHIAIVLDEYGGVTGLVTIEDILERIVGDIADEYDPAEEHPQIKRVSEVQFEVDAKMHVDDVNETVGLNLPEGSDYDTIGGFVFSALGHFPVAGETVEETNATITVLEVGQRRIKRLRVDLREVPQPV